MKYKALVRKIMSILLAEQGLTVADVSDLFQYIYRRIKFKTVINVGAVQPSITSAKKGWPQDVCTYCAGDCGEMAYIHNGDSGDIVGMMMVDRRDKKLRFSNSGVYNSIPIDNCPFCGMSLHDKSATGASPGNHQKNPLSRIRKGWILGHKRNGKRPVLRKEQKI